MANIRIKNLPAEATPNKNDLVPLDNATTRAATIEAIVNIGRPFASQAEAEAGVAANVAMNPLTTKQAIAAQGALIFQPFSPVLSATTASFTTADETKLDGLEASFIFASRAEAAASLPSASVDFLAYVQGGVEYRFVRDASGTALTTADGAKWSPAAPVKLRHWGLKGDGTPEDVVAFSAAMSWGKEIYDDGGDYVVDGATIQAAGGTVLIGAGEDKTRIIFKNMGGFGGLNGIEFSFPFDLPVTAPFGQVSGITHCSVVTDGAFGGSGIKTPTNPGGEGVVMYHRIRPKYVFKNLLLGSLSRDPASPSFMQFGIDGWNVCLHVGESADSEVEHVRFVQPLFADKPQATWAGKDQTVGLYLDAGYPDAGAGAIYHPQISHISGHGCGRLIKTRGFISVPKIHDMDGLYNGWGIYAEGPWNSPGGKLSSITEAIITGSNLNGIFGGIFIEATNQVHIDGVRTGFTYLPTMDYVGEWCGIKIPGGFQQVDCTGFRCGVSGAAPLTTFRVADLQGRWPDSASSPGLVNMTETFIVSSAPPSRWLPAIALRNVREASIQPPKAHSGSGLLATMLYVESDHALHTPIPPKINITGPLPYTFETAAIYGTGGSSSYVLWPVLNAAVGTAASISAAGSAIISPRNYTHHRQSFTAGSGPYTFDFNFSNEGAVPGQYVELYVIIPATNVTVRFLDEAAAVRLTLTSDGAQKIYNVKMMWIAAAGNTTTLRVQDAHLSLA